MYEIEAPPLRPAPVVVECVGCGALVKQGKIQRVMCWDCRSGSFVESPNVLLDVDGRWVNDRGVQRWVSNF